MKVGSKKYYDDGNGEPSTVVIKQEQYDTIIKRLGKLESKYKKLKEKYGSLLIDYMLAERDNKAYKELLDEWIVNPNIGEGEEE